MNVEEQIRSTLSTELNLSHLDLINESHMHSGDRTDTHFKLVAVSDDFSGLRAIQRHQKIYAALNDLMKNPIHALTMHLYTEAEWPEKADSVPDSPNCLGGSKQDKAAG